MIGTDLRHFLKVAPFPSDYVKRTHYNAPQTLFHYRQQALNGIWKARQAARDWNHKPTDTQQTTATSALKTEYSDADLTTLMLFPLIESQARMDPGLRKQIVDLLMAFLQRLEPMSIKGAQPRHQLDSLEKLLIDWLKEDYNQSTMECLLTLACARDSIDTLINTVDILRQTPNFSFARMDQVLEMDLTEKNPQVLDVHQHLQGFHYLTNKKNVVCKECMPSVKRSVIWQDDHLIVANDTGCQLSLVGTGHGRSLPGYVYARSDQCLGPSIYTRVKGVLLQRPIAFDK